MNQGSLAGVGGRQLKRGGGYRGSRNGATAPAYVCLAAASQASRLDLISAFLKEQRRARVWWSKAFPAVLQLMQLCKEGVGQLRWVWSFATQL